jgi:hypothetical protein
MVKGKQAAGFLRRTSMTACQNLHEPWQRRRCNLGSGFFTAAKPSD